jgi:hypothetical protein
MKLKLDEASHRFVDYLFALRYTIYLEWDLNNV